jgi:hypothetical protein
MISNNKIKEIIQEVTSTNGSRGSYVGPLQNGIRLFKKDQLDPYTVPVSKYDSPELEYDSYDGKIDTPKKKIKSIEKKAKKSSEYLKKHPNLTFSDDEGNIINPFPGKINEVDTTTSAGAYNGPMELGLRKWKKHILGPYTDEVNHHTTKKHKQKTLKNNVKRIVGVWEKDPYTKSHDVETYPVHTINEDLGVWFGTKKKPKGSKQPKGPWVNICRKVDGKHPPCGRPDTNKGGYPKCRAAGVAGKMSDSQKKAACQQKRKAEKKDTQSGKGQKPVMTSYKTRNESIGKLVNRILIEIRNSF